MAHSCADQGCQLNGLARRKGLRPGDVDPEQLSVGTEIELEHTSDRRLAAAIALDHLAEWPDYYTHLVEMEDEMKAVHGGEPKTLPVVGGFRPNEPWERRAPDWEQSVEITWNEAHDFLRGLQAQFRQLEASRDKAKSQKRKLEYDYDIADLALTAFRLNRRLGMSGAGPTVTLGWYPEYLQGWMLTPHEITDLLSETPNAMALADSMGGLSNLTAAQMNKVVYDAIYEIARSENPSIKYKRARE